MFRSSRVSARFASLSLVSFFLPIFLSLFSVSVMAADLCGIPHDNKENPYPEDNLSVEERVEILQSLFKNIRREYAVLELKKERLGIDADVIEKDCIDEEKKNDGISPLSSAGSPMNFADRSRVCIARFKDSHFNVSTVGNSPIITAGFVVQEIDKKFYVKYRYKRLLKFIETNGAGLSDLADRLKVGSEILEFNGQPISKLVDGYAKYISSSSEKGRRDKAVASIFQRNFRYPIDREFQIKLKTKPDNENEKAEEITLNLPWWVNDNGSDSLALRTLQRRGFCVDKIGEQSFDETKDEFVQNSDFEGYLESQKLLTTFDEKGAKSGDRIIARTGIAVPTRMKAFCYVQLKSFSGWGKVEVDNEKEAQSLKDHLKRFLQDCEQRDLGLVLDLRSNPGGNPNNPLAFFSLVATKEHSQFSFMTGYRNTRVGRRLLENFYAPEGTSGLSVNSRSETVLGRKVLQSTKLGEGLFLPLLRYADFNSVDTEAVYTKPIVTLVTPSCVSACDILSGFLKETKRSLIVGTETAGTGAGFISYGNVTSAWVDQSHRTITAKIPNFLFGRVAGTSEGELIPYSEGKKFITENQPVTATPGYEYETSLEDLLHEGRGWKKMAIKALYPEEEPDQNMPLIPMK